MVGVPDKVEYTPKRAPRVDANLKAVVTAGPKRSVPFTIDNMSVTGARLTGELTLAKGQTLSVTFTASGKSVTIEVEVVRVDTADLLTDQVAVRFIKVPDDAKDAIEEFVRTRLEEEEAAKNAPPDPHKTQEMAPLEPDAERTGEVDTTTIEVD
jgi:hypothetical protein